MEIDVRVKGTDYQLCRQTLAGGTRGGAVEKDVLLQHETIGTISETQTVTGPYFTCDIDFDVARPTVLEKKTTGEAIQLHFVTEADGRLTIQGPGKQHILEGGRHSLAYVPASESTYELTPGDRSIAYFTVVIPTETYFGLVEADSPLHAGFFTRRDRYYLAPETGIVTPEMGKIIRSLRECHRSGTLKRLFWEAGILELLMLQLEQFDTGRVGRISGRRDEDKLFEAREILDESLRKPPGIQELSRLIGLNEFKLKRGFREQFGTTIYQYVTARRMEQAQEWLRDGSRPIGEIAYLAGYKNHAHFTAAYKRIFGELPSQYRTLRHL